VLPEHAGESAPGIGVEAGRCGTWHVYILRCADDSLYTGITTDVTRRTREHNSGSRGAAYTRSRRPVDMVYCHPAPDRAQASRDEARIKRLTRVGKLRLIEVSGMTCNS